MMKTDTPYSGWKNYETWNVALWIGNDEGLYRMAKDYSRAVSPYQSFRDSLRDMFFSDDTPTRSFDPSSQTAPITLQTPDGVAWSDSGLDVDELDSMIRDL
jgi:hypothetical protein